MLRPLLLLGTRPEAIKMAPIVLESQRRESEIVPIVCLSGQHREMLRPVLDHFGIAAELDLALMRPGQTLAELTSRALAAIDEAIGRTRPDCVVAEGDTSTVLCASMAAFFRRVPFVHVEAGLRTRNLHAPWPEEFHRRVASLTAALHCAPTQRAAAALLAEGHPPERVRVTGNPIIDALFWTLEREIEQPGPWRDRHALLGERPVVLVTGHRRENFGTGFQNICHALAQLAERFPAVWFVYPVHLNPNVQGPVHVHLDRHANIRLLPPVPYPEFVWLLSRATLVLTDSGGVQEEAPSLGKPVLVMRETTERPESIEAGVAELVGTRVESIVERVTALLTDPGRSTPAPLTMSPYGDGRAAVRIVDWMLERPWREVPG
jgi:UDP-N-acetylglucosamine 2-epimerase (non-hydrolysing)